MPEYVTDDEVEKSRQRVDRLRAEVAAEERKQTTAVRSAENAHRKAVLDNEAERFEQELKQLRFRTSGGTSTSSGSDVSSPPPPTESKSSASTAGADEKE